ETQSFIEKPRRFIFLVHGLSGTEKTFGDLPEVLTEHGTRIQPAYDLKVIPIRYTTGDDSWTTYDFARHMGQQMLEAVGTVRDTDSITLVAHSQGGVISWIWYLNSLT